MHVHGEPWVLTNLRLLRQQIPLVTHGAENVISDAPLVSRVRRLGTRAAPERIDGYLSWGVLGLAAARDAGLPPGTPQAVLPASPPDPAIFRPLPLRAPDGNLRLVHVGRLVREKGIDTILEAMSLSEHRSQLSLEIIGEGPEEHRLRSTASALHVRATFHGQLPSQEVHKRLGESDLLVAASRDTSTWREQWGRSVVEAMFTGRAVLASDGGELRFVVGDGAAVFPQRECIRTVTSD